MLCTVVHASVQHRIFVVYAEVASQVENRQGAGIREGADQRYFKVKVKFAHPRYHRLMIVLRNTTSLEKFRSCQVITMPDYTRVTDVVP